MEAFKEKVILAVYNAPAIWDKKHKNHHNRYILEKQWKEIGIKLVVNDKKVKKTWKNLRQEFGKQFKKHGLPDGENEDQNPNWPYFEAMLFLKDQFPPRYHHGGHSHIYSADDDDSIGHNSDSESADPFPPTGDPRPPSSSSPSTLDLPDDECASSSYRNDRAVAPTNGQHYFPITQPLVQLEEGKKKSRKRRSIARDPWDEDVGFFNSLLPHVRTLHPRDKMIFRMKVQHLLTEMAYPAMNYPDAISIAPNDSLHIPMLHNPYYPNNSISNIQHSSCAANSSSKGSNTKTSDQEE